MEIVRFLPRHLFELRLQPAQTALRETIMKPDYGNALALAGPCFSVMLDGRPVACAGVQLFHAQRGEVWGLLSRESRGLMRPMTRAALGFFGTCGIRRLEINVATEFDAGHRWATMLGFRQEGPEKLGYQADGRGAIPYVRLQ